MASQQQLKDANYIHRGDNGEYLEETGQCGVPSCDHSKILTDNRTDQEYRYCIKLQKPVDFYDSCKYHSSERGNAYLSEMTTLLMKAEKSKTEQYQKETEKKKSHWILIPAMICIGILAYILTK